MFNTLPIAGLALALKGIGSALSNNAIYPDLVLNLPDNPMVQATITAWWNAAYAIGWAAGPVLGGVLHDAFLLNDLCFGEEADPPTPKHPKGCPGNTTFAVGTNSSSACLCEWRPANGFDGFSSSTALFSLAYALLLAMAIAANVRNRKSLPWRQRALLPESSLAATRPSSPTTRPSNSGWGPVDWLHPSPPSPLARPVESGPATPVGFHTVD